MRDTKAQARQHLQFLRKSQFSHSIEKKSQAISQQVFNFEIYQNASSIGLYHALSHEVQTNDIFHHAKRVRKVCFYPKVLGTDMKFGAVDDLSQLQKGKKNIFEPQFVSDRQLIDIFFVPAVGLDLWGTRLGQGGGHYDRFLQHSTGVAVGLCFEFQLQTKLSEEMHDQRMDWIVTEKRIIRCR